MRRAVRLIVSTLATLVIAAVGLAAAIVADGFAVDPGPADAAIVLGAAVADDRPTPVFEERLRHALELYRAGKVRLLLLTGGKGPGDSLAESDAGRAWLIANGVPAEAIFGEAESHTTLQNFVDVRPVLEAQGIQRVLVVSDPLHMHRAMRMARDLGLDAAPSPTPTTRYQTLTTQVPMLMREMWFTLVYAALHI